MTHPASHSADGTPWRISNAAQRVGATFRAMNPAQVSVGSATDVRLHVAPGWNVVCRLPVLEHPLLLGPVDLPEIINAGIRRAGWTGENKIPNSDDADKNNDSQNAGDRNFDYQLFVF